MYVEDRALTAAQWLSVRAELIAKHGAEYPVPNLLEFLATPGCPKIKNQWDRCGVPNHHGRAALRIVFLNALNEMPTRRARRLGCKFIVVRLMAHRTCSARCRCTLPPRRARARGVGPVEYRREPGI